VTAIFGVGIYTFFYTIIEKGVQTAAIPADAIARWQAYTGLTYQADTGFGDAAAAIVAQTALSTFVSFAAFWPDPVPGAAVSLFSPAGRP